ncbi:MAG: molecular chaperone Hsp33 [Alphaproteobacteria bacterium]|nr:molecular chaperone Hsp33 [Alphaproteobacteria bacterium]NCQ88199.1 molecular chaperone Hsp33 [Alphaproteobacteria bacterium]NCT05294.1 molecular chaperone Hsp33 [Alphaproteobacteria bacterium]
MGDEITGNVIRPFQLESSNLRGRIVRLDNVLDHIIVKHGYPKVVSQLLGETMTLCALLSSMLKYDGIFTLQTQGDGPIPMLVSDITSKGGVRGCATFKEERLEKIVSQLGSFSDDLDESDDNHLAQLLGKGYLAFTVDQGRHAEIYQGIVELKGASLVECVQHYFVQSEQIDTGIKMAVGMRKGVWRAAGIMLQRLPEEGGNAKASNFDEDDWRRAMVLLESCTEDELLSPDLTGHDILLRLFHEEGVRVFAPTPMTRSCRCSNEKVENVLIMMSAEDREEMTVDGEIKMKCEFCSTDYIFDPLQIETMIKNVKKDS